MKDRLDAALDAIERGALAECEHGYLARSCQACDALTEILALRGRLAEVSEAGQKVIVEHGRTGAHAEYMTGRAIDYLEAILASQKEESK